MKLERQSIPPAAANAANATPAAGHSRTNSNTAAGMGELTRPL